MTGLVIGIARDHRGPLRACDQRIHRLGARQWRELGDHAGDGGFAKIIAVIVVHVLVPNVDRSRERMIAGEAA